MDIQLMLRNFSQARNQLSYISYLIPGAFAYIHYIKLPTTEKKSYILRYISC